MSGLHRSTDVVAERSGGGPSSQTKSPGVTEFEPIVIERGRTHDETFEEWANKVQSKSRGEKVSLKD